MNENKCVLCDTEYKSGYLVGGICDTCKKEFPGAKTKEDMKKKKKPEIENHETLVKELVTKQVNDLLESFGILHRCLTCSNLFFKRSPAQKSCGCDKVANKTEVK